MSYAEYPDHINDDEVPSWSGSQSLDILRKVLDRRYKTTQDPASARSLAAIYLGTVLGLHLADSVGENRFTLSDIRLIAKKQSEEIKEILEQAMAGNWQPTQAYFRNIAAHHMERIHFESRREDGGNSDFFEHSAEVYANLARSLAPTISVESVIQGLNDPQ